MTTDLQLAAWAIALTWLMVWTAGMLKGSVWTPKALWRAVGNRDAMPEPTPFAARADRAAKNMLENIVLFIGLVAVVHLGGRHNDRADLAAHIWFWSRLAYWLVYLAGIPVLRTVIWWISIGALGLLFSTTL